MGINKLNVGRIAERVVSNELEYRGLRVSDLNKEGTSANADLLAVKDGTAWQIQGKGATAIKAMLSVFRRRYSFPNDSFARCDESLIHRLTVYSVSPSIGSSLRNPRDPLAI